MARLPPRAQLQRVLTALAASLPEQLGAGLEHPRFAHELPALLRFRDDDHTMAALDAMPEAEQAQLAQALLHHWSALVEVELPPACAILPPHDHWIAHGTREVTVEVAVDGLDDGWTAAWRGADGDGPTARLRLAPRDEVALQVRVEGRGDGARTLLVGTATLRARVPMVRVSGDKCHVTDHRERPARFVHVAVGEREFHTDGSGLVQVEGGVPVGATIRVQGVGVEV